VRATVEDWQEGRREEGQTLEAIVAHVRDLHRKAGKALGIGRRLECCLEDDGSMTAGATTTGLSLALSVALGAATASAGGATEPKGSGDGSEVQARFNAELGLVEQEARALAKRIPSFRAGVDDLRAFGLEGLLDAARRFDAERGVAFARWARHRIRTAMLDGVQAACGRPRDPHAVAVAHAAPTPVASPEKVLADAEELALLPGLLKDLPSDERRLLERCYLGGESLAQAAADLGLPPSTASRMHGRALASLRRQLRPSDTV
jgi:RNA polymerase sigma factor (sigma-70 family)